MIFSTLASLAFAAIVLSGSPGISAQSSSPAPDTCIHPAAPNWASPTGAEQPGVAAAPTADTAQDPLADNETAIRIIAGIENFVACRNAGDYAAYAALLTPNRILAETGTTNPADVVAGLQAFNLPITIISLDDVRQHPDGRLSAEFVHLFGDHLYYRSRIYVIEEDGFVKFDEEQYLPEEIQGDQAIIDTGLLDFAFELDQSTVDNAPFVILRGHNEGALAHEIIAVRLPEGATVEQALSGEVDESQIDFIGQVTIAPGATDDLVLANLAPGTYTLLCLLTEPDGVPHAAQGMVAQFTIEGMATPIAISA